MTGSRSIQPFLIVVMLGLMSCSTVMLCAADMSSPSPPPPSPSPPPPSPSPPLYPTDDTLTPLLTTTSSAPKPMVCKGSSFLQMHMGKYRCKACVSLIFPSGFNTAKKCYNSVSTKRGTECGTAVLIAKPDPTRKGYCVDPHAMTHGVKLEMGPSSNGVVLKSIVLHSLRLGGPRGTEKSNSASMTRMQGTESSVHLVFRGPLTALKARSHVRLTGYSKAKYSGLPVCFTALVLVC